MLTAEDRTHVEGLLAATKRTHETGNVVVNTPTVLEWIRTNRGRNRGIDPNWAHANLDPEGLHIVSNMMLHNDVEFRLRILAKTKDSMAPTELWQDVSFEDWTRAREASQRTIDALAAQLAG